MRPTDDSTRNKYIQLIIICCLNIGLSALVVTSLKKNNNPSPSTDEIFLNFIEQSSVLQEGFQDLQSLNRQYIFITADTLSRTKLVLLDSLQEKLKNQQLKYSLLLDSIQANASSRNKNSFDLFNRIIQAYRNAYNESVIASKIANNQAMQISGYGIDSSMYMAMRNQLQKNEIEKINLSEQLNVSEKNRELNSPQNFKKLLKTQDTTLYNMLEKEHARNENLINYNLKLEKDITNLKHQLENKRQSNLPSANDASGKMEVTKAAIDLGNVDCYLLRADPKQIISNSRQRKVLLENALNILNALSNSSNTNIQKAVKDRMAKLEQIASDNHD